jgi:pyridoxamine 5'-phosphate oxidase
VRIEGPVEGVSDAEADAYFATRARDSQLGAWASDQSRPLDSRETFERRFEEVKRRFEGQDVPRPPHWGGYRVIPERIEFWIDRQYRLHERRLFTRNRASWTEGLLYP